MMDHYLLLKILHSLPAALLPLGVIAHLVLLWKARQRAEPGVLPRKLRRTRLISLPVMGVLALTLPVSGWQLVHGVGWPLGQFWLLGSAVLFGLLILFGLLLAGRLAAWEALGDTPAPQRLLRFNLAYAAVILLLLLAILGLMGAKPA